MADVAVQLRIRLLGTPEVWIAGTPLMLHHQKAQALLYYLTATGSLHTRDHLATLLWSESPESNARHSLRSSLYHMRQALLYRDVNCGKAQSLEPENRPRPATMSCRTHELPNIVYEPGDDVSMAESRGERFLSEGRDQYKARTSQRLDEVVLNRIVRGSGSRSDPRLVEDGGDMGADRRQTHHQPLGDLRSHALVGCGVNTSTPLV